jgi:hypothetical protein
MSSQAHYLTGSRGRITAVKAETFCQAAFYSHNEKQPHPSERTECEFHDSTMKTVVFEREIQGDLVDVMIVRGNVARSSASFMLYFPQNAKLQTNMLPRSTCV